MKVKILFSFILFIHSLSIIYAQNDIDLKKKYIEQFKWIAVREMELTGIPACIKLAQGLLESNAGFSTLATEANNHFGMKCHNDWNGLTFYKVDDDRDAKGNLVPSCFRKFKSPEESYHAHSLWLTQRSRYSDLFTLDPTDYKGWAHGLKKAGYATDPAYGDKLISVIEKFNLNAIQPVPEPPELVYEIKSESKQKEKLIFKETVKPTEVVDNVQPGIWVINNVQFVYAKPNMKLSEIASSYEVPLKKLPRYNPSIQENPNLPFTTGQPIFLEPKRKAFHGKQTWHIVRANETIKSISDYYAIHAESLRARNRLFHSEEPTIGLKLKLKGKKIQIK